MDWPRSNIFFRLLAAMSIGVCTVAAAIPWMVDDYDDGLPWSLAILSLLAASVMTATTAYSRHPGPYRAPVLNWIGPVLAASLSVIYFAEAAGWPTAMGVRSVRTVGSAWLSYVGVYYPIWTAVLTDRATRSALRQIERVGDEVAATASLIIAEKCLS